MGFALQCISYWKSRIGRDLKLQRKKAKRKGVFVHDCACVYVLLSVCNCAFGVLHSAVCSSGD